ncbi:MAG: HAMP domain-containing histidine kinase [Melioribacteraceae bacterium]|nr:HAMP domain-containing histidine kinase [Melioribacteraceae bacterium]MCF8395422.1 HAMP domain-containing histidine kinase [Melioribacteraceae bacterium]MCF8420756.1 HAMP domain-containing histidine kinase [Melioribacteraceae bacterium]
MKKRRSLFFHISIFVLAQLAWLGLLGIWIYWYVSNYIIFEEVSEQVSSKVFYDNINLLPFVGGLILLVGISVGMSLTFRYLNVQLKLTKMYDNFIGNVTHELKSPLSSMQLYLETLSSREVPKETQQRFYELMLKDASRLNNLINSILEISALEQKKVSHDYQIHDAGDIIRRTINESLDQFKINPEDVEIKGTINKKCVVDAHALKIVFDNLIDNAIKYSVNPIKLLIELDSNQKKIFIKFTDNGIGISIDDQKKIFNKFERIYNSDVPNVKGTGSGLYWTKEIIKNHGGNITVFSKGKNEGAVFQIELPVYGATKRRFLNKLLSAANKPEKQVDLGDEQYV